MTPIKTFPCGVAVIALAACEKSNAVEVYNGPHGNANQTLPDCPGGAPPRLICLHGGGKELQRRSRW
jgi:hypothetical protein